jgi:Kef-type K+ transport system membrane component KefB
MSSTGESRRGINRWVELGLLLVLVGLMLLATNATQGSGRSHVLAALGFLLLAGTVVANVLEPLGIPHLTAYLLAGMAAGPYALHLVDHQAVTELSPINALALSLIALAGGAELRISKLISAARSLLWATLLQNVMVLVLMAGIFLALRPMLPFVAGLPLTVVLGIALLWGVVGITRSPSATLGVLSQTGAKGPLATFTLAFVMTSDVVVVVVLALVFTVTRPLLEPGSAFSLRAFQELGHEVLGSVALGSTVGLLLAAYLRFVGRQLVLVFVALGLVLTQVLDYLRFDWLLIFITAGFVVQNLSAQGDKFLEEIHRLGEIVYVIFFATAGAHLDLPLLAQLWPAALALTVGRAGCTWFAARLSSRLADDPPSLRRWGWAGLVSQAGLALGIAAKIQKEHPGYGAGFAAMAVATVAMNELVGPILFKTALDRSGETASHGDVDEPAAAPAVDPAR